MTETFHPDRILGVLLFKLRMIIEKKINLTLEVLIMTTADNILIFYVL